MPYTSGATASSPHFLALSVFRIAVVPTTDVKVTWNLYLSQTQVTTLPIQMWHLYKFQILNLGQRQQINVGGTP